MGRLDDLDLARTLRRDEYARRLIAAQRRFLQLRLTLGGQLTDGTLGPGLLVVMEGPDAAGKGSAIKRIVEPLDPRHYRVSSFSKPDADEKRHHFLRRFFREIPGLGGMCVFDRSWYGRVLVERIEGFATDDQWQRAYDEIVGFEQTLVLEGVMIVKFWLHIDDDEQLRRFQSRERDPLRRWKITDEDWRNRDKAPAYVVRRRGHVRAHRPRAGAVEPDRGQPEALHPGRRPRHPQPAHRGGHGTLGHPGPRRGLTAPGGLTPQA